MSFSRDEKVEPGCYWVQSFQLKRITFFGNANGCEWKGFVFQRYLDCGQISWHSNGGAVRDTEAEH